MDADCADGIVDFEPSLHKVVDPVHYERRNDSNDHSGPRSHIGAGCCDAHKPRQGAVTGLDNVDLAGADETSINGRYSSRSSSKKRVNGDN